MGILRNSFIALAGIVAFTAIPAKAETQYVLTGVLAGKNIKSVDNRYTSIGKFPESIYFQNLVLDITFGEKNEILSVRKAEEYWKRYLYFSCTAYVYADGKTTNGIPVGFHSFGDFQISKDAIVEYSPQGYNLITSSGKQGIQEVQAAPILDSLYCFNRAVFIKY